MDWRIASRFPSPLDFQSLAMPVMGVVEDVFADVAPVLKNGGDEKLRRKKACLSLDFRSTCYQPPLGNLVWSRVGLLELMPFPVPLISFVRLKRTKAEQRRKPMDSYQPRKKNKC
jgi:hypothetical protein